MVFTWSERVANRVSRFLTRAWVTPAGMLIAASLIFLSEDRWSVVPDALALSLLLVLHAQTRRNEDAIQVKLDLIADHLGVPEVRAADREGADELESEL